MFDNCLKHDYNNVTIASFFKIASGYDLKTKADNIEVVSVIKKTSDPLLATNYSYENPDRLRTLIGNKGLDTLPDQPEEIFSRIETVKERENGREYIDFPS